MALQALAREFLKVPHNRFQHFSDESSTKIKLGFVLAAFLVVTHIPSIIISTIKQALKLMQLLW